MSKIQCHWEWNLENKNVLRPLQNELGIFTHRRSISTAERGGCFQWHPFVCLFVNMITSEQLHVGWWNLAVRCTVQKSCPSSMVKVKGQRLRSPGTKKRKTAESSPLTMHNTACAVARQYAANSNRRYHCVPIGTGGDDYAGGKISACCLVTPTDLY